jgi:hypothetical protein
LPAEQAIWLVIGMALLRQESIERVVMMLGLALPTSKGDAVAKSGITQARRRLGEDPLAYLFATTADRWATQSADRHRWRGLWASRPAWRRSQTKRSKHIQRFKATSVDT